MAKSSCTAQTLVACPLSGGKDLSFAPMSVALPNSVIQDGVLKALMIEGQDEITYLDNVSLQVVTHRKGDVVFSSTALYYKILKQDDPQIFYSFPAASFLYPVSATWRNQVDVTESISVQNDTAVTYDLAADNWYNVDFGNVVIGDHQYLLVDGWKSKIQRLGYPMEKANSRPRLQVKNEEGSWVLAKKLSWPRGDKKTVVFDISDVQFPTGRCEMRIWTGTSRDAMATWFIDSVKITTAAPGQTTTTTIPASSALLEAHGMPEYVWKKVDRPLTNIPNGKGLAAVPTYTSGNFTKYGDVIELISKADSKFCIMQKGDGITFEFSVPNFEAEGLEQSYFLNCDLVYKPQVCPGVAALVPYLRTVEPLPLRELPTYPPKEELKLSKEMQEYIACWNTREYHPMQRMENAVFQS